MTAGSEGVVARLHDVERMAERLMADARDRPGLSISDWVATCMREAVDAPALADQRDELRREIINTPETADFMAGVPLEAAHQRERWAAEHDVGKAPEDWLFLVGYLAGKACAAVRTGDTEKALHHTISTAAALANWHAHLSGTDTRMRPGMGPPAALARTERTS